ncbi:hypothetical protein K432DRAFT_408987 [Lepidopterella palustris CBS 459.81]|uniref:Uncharacterized protein n=1 Tax=Lepidopterella palustris CBS 459.81 TaxID=1314670 RepID=A0A8E2E158_9PEZI|nr:hypothetical protein K432DRAFT_408987 [Lepidopterella palustris CBS 459.81]
MTTLSTLLTLATLIPQSFEIITSRSLDHRTSCPSGKTLPPGHLNPTLMAPIVASAPNFVFSGTQVPLITPNDICTIFDHVSRPLPGATQDTTYNKQPPPGPSPPSPPSDLKPGNAYTVNEDPYGVQPAICQVIAWDARFGFFVAIS